MSVTDVGGDKRIFLRKASGLIRTAGLTDTFIYNLGVVSIGLGVGSMLYYGPAFYPQGDLIWGCIIAGVGDGDDFLRLHHLDVTLPRSGGIYVFGSRILPPALALTMSLVEITAWLFYCAIAAYWMVILALGADVRRAQPAYGQRDLPLDLANHARALVHILDRRGDSPSLAGRTFLWHALLSHPQQVGLRAGYGEHRVLIVVLATASREQFVTNLNELVGPSLGVPDAYNAIIASGKEKGWGTAGFDLWQTVLVSNWPFLPLIGAAFSIAIGGEIKSVGKSQTVGMLGAVFVATVALADHGVAGLQSVRLRVPRHRRVQRAERQWRPDHADRSVRSPFSPAF